MFQINRSMSVLAGYAAIVIVLRAGAGIFPGSVIALVSMDAAAVTSLKIDPGVNVEEKNRFM